MFSWDGNSSAVPLRIKNFEDCCATARIVARMKNASGLTYKLVLIICVALGIPCADADRCETLCGLDCGWIRKCKVDGFTCECELDFGKIFGIAVAVGVFLLASGYCSKRRFANPDESHNHAESRPRQSSNVLSSPASHQHLVAWPAAPTSAYYPTPTYHDLVHHLQAHSRNHTYPHRPPPHVILTHTQR
eukprot:9504030-Pyramimonas_sp.AAC.1